MRTFLIISLIFAGSLNAQPNHDLWTQVLKTHVSSEGLVNYKDLTTSPEPLISYLNELIAQQPNEQWSYEDRMSYWINAYNAYTIKLIIDNYPTKSIKALKTPWDQKFIPYNKTLISLNDVEHKILRKMDDPRIHFSIVCASISCPKLAQKAYTAESLDSQLNEATQHFLNDTSKNTFDKEVLEISKIFKWFSKDFKASGGVFEFIKSYKTINNSQKTKLSYKTYNWGLNE